MFQEYLGADGSSLVQINVALVRRIESVSVRGGRPTVRVWFDKNDFIDILAKLADVGRSFNKAFPEKPG